MKQFTVDMMQERFWEATAEKEKLDANTEPLRRERDDLVLDATPMNDKIKELGRKIRVIESPERSLLDEELSMIARALGNRVGKRPTD